MFDGDVLRECLCFQESHSSFPAVNARYVRMTFDQTNCAQPDNYVRLYELQVLAAVPSEVCSKTLTVSGAGTSQGADADAGAGVGTGTGTGTGADTCTDTGACAGA